MNDREAPESGALPPSPLAWKLKIDSVGDGIEVNRAADADERAALRDLGDLVDVRRMEAQLTVRPWRKTGFSVRGHVEAEVVQSCVVTLKPVVQTLREEVDVKLVPAREAARWRIDPDEAGEIVIDAEAEDPPDLFSGNELDLGVVAAEHFALGLDPYPRAPGVAFAATEPAGDEERKPFAGLADMLRRREGKPSE